MNEFDPVSRSLLAAAARCHEPGEADRVRIRRRLIKRLGLAAGFGALGSAVTQTNSAVAASEALTKGTLLSTALESAKVLALGKVVGVAVAVSAAGVGAYEWMAPTHAPQRAASSVHANTPLPSARSAMPRTASPVASDEPLQPALASPAFDPLPQPEGMLPIRKPEPTVANAPSSTQRLPPGSSGADARDATLPAVASFPAEATPKLAAEARALARAQAALREGDAAQALRLLEEQATQFSYGQLDEERAAARVLALCKVGKTEAANAAAAEFLRSAPNSVLAERVANACANRK